MASSKSAPPCLDAPPAASRKLAVTNNKFTLTLYQAQRACSTENILLAPWSIFSLFIMVCLGCRGRTEEQVIDILGLMPLLDEAIPKLVHQAHLSLYKMIFESIQGCMLKAANRIYIQSGPHFQEEYLSDLKTYYKSDLLTANFLNDPELARSKINRWVAECTDERVLDIIPPDTLTSETAMVLVNALYFKGEWGSPFKPHLTLDAEFYISKEEKTSVPLMHQTGLFQYKHSMALKCQVLALPYTGGKFSMVVILPDKMNGLKGVEINLNTDVMKALTTDLVDQTISVYLPKFTLRSTFSIKDTLTRLGMTDVFDPEKADLSGICQRPMHISSAVHSAFVDINEEGSEAAAASVAIGRFTSTAPEPPVPVFRADHPFLFLIRHNPSSTVLFVGRLVRPNGDY